VIERGNTKHDPEQDEQLRHEAQGIVQGRGGVGHVDEARQTEPLPDDTDSPEVVQAARIDGGLADDVTDSTPGASVADAEGDDDTLSETAAGLTADPVVLTTETPEDVEPEGAETDGADPSAHGQPITDVAEEQR
jgi:hypothetical protein